MANDVQTLRQYADDRRRQLKAEYGVALVEAVRLYPTLSHEGDWITSPGRWRLGTSPPSDCGVG